MFLTILTHIYSVGIIIVIFIALMTLLTLAFFRKEENAWLSYVKRNALNLYVTLLSLGTAGSLYYSELGQFTPCKLCWWQRIFIFPQLLIGIIAKVKKSLSSDGWLYLAWMTGIGFAISLLHNYVYYFGKENSITCDAAASCKAYYVYTYGFVTIPFMALGLLFALATILFVRKYYIGDALNIVSAE